MGVLEDLIKIKSNKQEDDLLKMLDEIPVYEKLSVNEAFKDLKNSEVTRKKCPLLAGFVDGKLYETMLADLVSNVYLQIEGTMPAILLNAAEKTLKQRRQMEILQMGIAHVEYRDLTEYDHKEMESRLAAVFTKKQNTVTTAVVIIKTQDGYTMYHGTYAATEDDKSVKNVYTPVIGKGKKGILTVESYSVLGNNGYRFAKYVSAEAMYDVMIGPDGELYLLDGDNAVVTHQIPWQERNILNMSKKDPQDFADLLASIIESVV